MDSVELKKRFIEFFVSRSHAEVLSAPLVPENDPSVLFTTAGMHPLVPFLLGEPHPKGSKIVNFQKCIRTGDIDEVGDDVHLTFFEMLGNWSFNDYWKEEAISMSFDFLTKVLRLPVEKLAISCFKGDKSAPRDVESANIWMSKGVLKDRIAFLPKSDNWWGPAGTTGPCGPDTEMFFWKGDNPPRVFDPKDERWVEIWNDVFMQYEKTIDGKYLPLKQKNVDTGMGVERVDMVLNHKNNVYEIDSLKEIYGVIKKLSNINKETDEQKTSLRIITDHMRASVFILGDERGVVPSNVDQGYILRRFIRRCIRHLYLLGVKDGVEDKIVRIADKVIVTYKNQYPDLEVKKSFINDELKKEGVKFITTLERGLSEIKKEIKRGRKVDSKWLFDLFQSFGMPPEITLEELKNAYKVDIKNKDFLLKKFDELFKKHQELSRAGAQKRFKGGLADESEMSRKLHTATHLLNEALRKVLSDDIRQKGSNITSERLRFDFNFSRKLTDEEKVAVEKFVNEKIKAGLNVTKEKMPLKDALKSGAQSEFGAKYPDKVWVYSVGDFSKEICMGPHVNNTKELGVFKIKKEQGVAAGVRRIKAVLE